MVISITSNYEKLMGKYDIKSEKYKQLKYEYQLLQSKYRAKEGQTGHKKHKLEKFSDEEINDNVSYELKECPSCGGNLTQTGEIFKDETSYRFVPIKRRNHFIQYKCDCCGKEVNQNIPIRLQEENQYSSEVQPMALTLGNEGNVSINKIRRIIRGFLMALLI